MAIKGSNYQNASSAFNSINNMLSGIVQNASKQKTPVQTFKSVANDFSKINSMLDTFTESFVYKSGPAKIQYADDAIKQSTKLLDQLNKKIETEKKAAADLILTQSLLNELVAKGKTQTEALKTISKEDLDNLVINTNKIMESAKLTNALIDNNVLTADDLMNGSVSAKDVILPYLNELIANKNTPIVTPQIKAIENFDPNALYTFVQGKGVPGQKELLSVEVVKGSVLNLAGENPTKWDAIAEGTSLGEYRVATGFDDAGKLEYHWTSAKVLGGENKPKTVDTVQITTTTPEGGKKTTTVSKQSLVTPKETEQLKATPQQTSILATMKTASPTGDFIPVALMNQNGVKVTLTNDKWKLPGIDESNPINRALVGVQEIYEGTNREMVNKGWLNSEKVEIASGISGNIPTQTFAQQFGSETPRATIATATLYVPKNEGKKVIAETAEAKKNGEVVNYLNDRLFYGYASDDQIKAVAPKILARDSNNIYGTKIASVLGSDGIDAVWDTKEVRDAIADKSLFEGQTAEKSIGILKELLSFKVTGDPISDGLLLVAGGGFFGETSIVGGKALNALAKTDSILSKAVKLAENIPANTLDFSNYVNKATLPVPELNLLPTRANSILMVPTSDTGKIAKLSTENILTKPTKMQITEVLDNGKLQTWGGLDTIKTMQRALDVALDNKELKVPELINVIVKSPEEHSIAALTELLSTEPMTVKNLVDSSATFSKIAPNDAFEAMRRLDEATSKFEKMSIDLGDTIIQKSNGNIEDAGKLLQEASQPTVLGRTPVVNMMNKAIENAILTGSDKAQTLRLALDEMETIDKQLRVLVPEIKTVSGLTGSTPGIIAKQSFELVNVMPENVADLLVRKSGTAEVRKITSIKEIAALTDTEIATMAKDTDIQRAVKALNNEQLAKVKLGDYKKASTEQLFPYELDRQSLIDNYTFRPETSLDEYAVAEDLVIVDNARLEEEMDELVRSSIDPVEREIAELGFMRDATGTWNWNQKQTARLSTGRFKTLMERNLDALAPAMKNISPSKIRDATIQTDKKLLLINDYVDVLKMGEAEEIVPKAVVATKDMEIQDTISKALSLLGNGKADDAAKTLSEVRGGADNLMFDADKLAKAKGVDIGTITGLRGKTGISDKTINNMARAASEAALNKMKIAAKNDLEMKKIIFKIEEGDALGTADLKKLWQPENRDMAMDALWHEKMELNLPQLMQNDIATRMKSATGKELEALMTENTKFIDDLNTEMIKSMDAGRMCGL